MPHVPILPLAGMTIMAYAAVFAFYGEDVFSPPEGDPSPLTVAVDVVADILNFLTFSIPDIHQLVRVGLFLTLAVPWALVIIEATGTVGTILTIFGLVAGFISSLFG